MKARYIKNIMNLDENNKSKDTAAVIGEVYEVVQKKGVFVECNVGGEDLSFRTEELEFIDE